MFELRRLDETTSGMSRYKDQGEALGHTDIKGQGKKGTSKNTTE